MNNSRESISSNTLNNDLDFSIVELNPGWRKREEFFDGFRLHAPLFSYQINYNGDFYSNNFIDSGTQDTTNAVKTTNGQAGSYEKFISRRLLVFDSPPEFLNIERTELLSIAKNFNFIAVKSRYRYSNFGCDGLNEAYEKIAKTAADAGILKIRLYVPSRECGSDSALHSNSYSHSRSDLYSNSNSYSCDEISQFIEYLTRRNLLDKNKLSLCFQKSAITDTIELNTRLAAKFPALSALLHIETAKESNRVETAILFYLKFNSPELKDSTIASIFSSRPETAGLKESAEPVTDNSNSRYLDTLEILRSLEFNNIPGVFFISCPTCSRCKINLIGCAKSVYARVKYIETPLKIAVMGCEVNGPGEASHADIGAAGSIERAVIFERGKIVERVAANDIEDKLMERIKNYVK